MPTKPTPQVKKYRQSNKNRSYGDYHGIFLRYLNKLSWDRSMRKKDRHSRYTANDNMQLIMYLVATGIPLTMVDIARLTRLHRNTVNKYIGILWRECEVAIQWKVTGKKVGDGHYVLTDWGIYLSERVIARVIREYGFREIHKVLNVVRREQGLQMLPC